MQFPVRILGTGSQLPAERVTAAGLDSRLGLQPGTTLARNGVSTRYFANEAESASALATQAVAQALRTAQLSAVDLDAILFAGVMSEQPMPSTAILIHRRLGGRAHGVTCFDINASCAGFLKGVEIAAAGVCGGLWRNVAVVAAELASKGLRWEDLDTATLFGDGAAAAILGPATGNEGILAVRNATYSEGAELSMMRAGGSRFNMRTPPADVNDYLFAMNGRGLLRLIQTHFPAFLDELLAIGVDVVVPHQASAVGLAFLHKQLARRSQPAPVVIDILRETGNQVSVSIPFALHGAIDSGQLRRGQTALLVSTAAGVSFSGMVLRY
jgi:3-oxoacyl-[acyl-carrier-protein] synthase-3